MCPWGHFSFHTCTVGVSTHVSVSPRDSCHAVVTGHRPGHRRCCDFIPNQNPVSGAYPTLFPPGTTACLRVAQGGPGCERGRHQLASRCADRWSVRRLPCTSRVPEWEAAGAERGLWGCHESGGFVVLAPSRTSCLTLWRALSPRPSWCQRRTDAEGCGRQSGRGGVLGSEVSVLQPRAPSLPPVCP